MSTQLPVTRDESIAAFSNMLRCAFSTIAFLRGYCEDHCFREVYIGGRRFMRLLDDPLSDEATVLHDWIEDGVLSTFKRGYLEQVALQTFSVPPQKRLLEVFSFSFAYGAEGQPVIDARCAHSYNNMHTHQQVMHVSSQTGIDYTGAAAAASPRRFSVAAPPSKEALRDTITTMLGELVRVLEAMPPPDAQRCIGMRLAYVDDVTPPEFEPPHFVPVSRQQVLVDMAKERMLSVSRQCDGDSGFHHLNFGLMYQAPDPSQDLNSADFYGAPRDTLDLLPNSKPGEEAEDDECDPTAEVGSPRAPSVHPQRVGVLGCAASP